MSNTLRIGLVGAGNNTRAKHIPGFLALEDVQIVSVANRTRESGERVAGEFNIPNVYNNWLDLVAASDTDAICIGTWPYLHCPVTFAALDCHKHVLCEARMAMNANEAHLMFDAARARPDLVAQVVPAPHTLKVDEVICELIAAGALGEIVAVDLQVYSQKFIDRNAPMHWRQDIDLSGFNMLSVGIWYEALMRWLGPADRVMAMTAVNTSQRRDAEGRLYSVRVPDHVDIIAHLARGGQANLRFSAVTGLAPANTVLLYGTEATLKLDADAMKLFLGRRGEDALEEVAIPPKKQGTWRVEEEFINAIRGLEPVRRTTFADGVRYMEFTEAVIQSAQSGQAVPL